jgi:hypothetical protein
MKNQHLRNKVTGSVKYLLPLCLFILLPFSVSAQDEPEYRLDIGGGVGVVSYLGDLNENLLKDLQPMGALIGRLKMNPRMALSLQIGYGKLKGDSKDVKTWYPEMQDVSLSFNNSLIDVSLKYEYNFWPYGTGREYRGAKPLTPYIALGLGGTFVSGNKSTVTANLPLAVGVKYKVGQRLNLALEWAMHFTLSDQLDGVKDPYGIKSSGLFKNTDCYSSLQLSLTYDLWAKCKTCHNDRD